MAHTKSRHLYHIRGALQFSPGFLPQSLKLIALPFIKNRISSRVLQSLALRLFKRRDKQHNLEKKITKNEREKVETRKKISTRMSTRTISTSLFTSVTISELLLQTHDGKCTIVLSESFNVHHIHSNVQSDRVIEILTSTDKRHYTENKILLPTKMRDQQSCM